MISTAYSNLITRYNDSSFLQDESDAAFTDEVEGIEKRNSELLNSLLAMPVNIHRSGK